MIIILRGKLYFIASSEVQGHSNPFKVIRKPNEIVVLCSARIDNHFNAHKETEINICKKHDLMLLTSGSGTYWIERDDALFVGNDYNFRQDCLPIVQLEHMGLLPEDFDLIDFFGNNFGVHNSRFKIFDYEELLDGLTESRSWGNKFTNDMSPIDRQRISNLDRGRYGFN